MHANVFFKTNFYHTLYTLRHSILCNVLLNPYMCDVQGFGMEQICTKCVLLSLLLIIINERLI